MENMRGLIRDTLTGKSMYGFQIVCSIPGMGKTETALQVFKKTGINRPTDSIVSVKTSKALAFELWNKFPNKPMLIDDSDQLATSPTTGNMGKKAWGPQRLVVCDMTDEIRKNGNCSPWVE